MGNLLRVVRDRAERKAILEALNEAGTITGAARTLEMDRNYLRRRMQKLRIQRAVTPAEPEPPEAA
jgi:transcriptional regulator with GAF, ATPase, and Fis domain